MENIAKFLGQIRESTFLASVLLSISIILIAIGIGCSDKTNHSTTPAAYWIGGGLAILPIAGYIFYHARKSELNKSIKELQKLNSTNYKEI